MTTIEEEWNKMSEEFILKEGMQIVSKRMAAVLSKFIVLCLSYFVFFFFF